MKTFHGRRFSRNRKNTKFDQKLASEFCVSENNIKIKIKTLSKMFKCINLEIGFGNGDNLTDLAFNNPDAGFVGCDPFWSGNVNALKKISLMSLKNIMITNLEFDKFFKYSSNVTYENVYILFPDPWPKTRHRKRRLVNNQFLKIIKTIINTKGKVFLKSDNADYIRQMVSLFISDENFSMVRTFIGGKNFLPLKNTKYANKAVQNRNFPHLIVFQFMR